MIDEELTFQKFGYKSTDLSLHSGKKIVAVCDDCGKARVVIKNAYCPHCYRCSLVYRENKNTKYTKVLTEKTLEYCIKNQLSTDETAKKFNCKDYNVIHYLRKFHMFTVGELRKLQRDKILTYDFLYEHYIKQQLSATEIGRLVGCSYQIIIERLQKLGISVRTNKETHRTKVYRAKRSGEGNSNWGGGECPLYDAVRGLLEMEDWRISCLERDGFACRDCYSQEGRLDVHHIHKSYIDLLQEFLQHYSHLSPTTDKETLVKLAQTWTPFWDVDNGKTLCKPCHRKEHSRLKKLAKQQKLILEKNK